MANIVDIRNVAALDKLDEIGEQSGERLNLDRIALEANGIASR